MWRVLYFLIGLGIQFSCSQSVEPVVKEDRSEHERVIGESFFTDMDSDVPHKQIVNSYDSKNRLSKRTVYNTTDGTVMSYEEFLYYDELKVSHILGFERTQNKKGESFDLTLLKECYYGDSGGLDSVKTEQIAAKCIDMTYFHYKHDRLDQVQENSLNGKSRVVSYDYNKKDRLDVVTVYDQNNFILYWTEYKYHNNILSTEIRFSRTGELQLEKYYHYNTYNELVLMEQCDKTEEQIDGTFLIRYEYQ